MDVSLQVQMEPDGTCLFVYGSWSCVVVVVDADLRPLSSLLRRAIKLMQSNTTVKVYTLQFFIGFDTWVDGVCAAAELLLHYTGWGGGDGGVVEGRGSAPQPPLTEAPACVTQSPAPKMTIKLNQHVSETV